MGLDNKRKVKEQVFNYAVEARCRAIAAPIRRRNNRNLTGARFGHLKVICRSPETRRVWKCQCDCGSEVLVAKTELRHNPDLSCGCIRLSRNRRTAPYMTEK